MHGSARFTSPDSLDVDGTEYTADAFLLATGAKPMRLGMPGAELLIDSERFMELAELPERVVFVGGGFISFEFAGIALPRAPSQSSCIAAPNRSRASTPISSAMLIAQYAEWGIEVRVEHARRQRPTRGRRLR